MTTLSEPIMRPALVADAPAIVALIDDLMPFLTLHPDGAGAEKFIQHCRQPAIEGYLSLPNYAYQLAYLDGELAGVVAMRDNTHLFHLFVPRALHRRGMARRLWQAAREVSLARGGVTAFTVNSSLYALPLYASLGFVATGPKVEMDGIAFVSMRMPL
ncbi:MULTISPECIES: GNAT family N-acetyltransferase [unclassified Janthinobacterium]|uniref:GNAT family N-acetyltransferase n=1 Tax=unclassified Janthinobacterium TaxID=2610881 RepID=UPI001A22FC4A|nr:GNAT family N-acetyltransferase [Janthinobacterium sp. CG_23.4]MDH6159079.1 GNAT superfamily N-acetyltransferase [Janthinobacterium sp. CG_23.4]